MVKLKLTSNEALVLVEFLLRFRDEEKLIITDPSEEQILWDLLAMLESEVPELLDNNYKLLLKEAQNDIKSDSK